MKTTGGVTATAQNAVPELSRTGRYVVLVAAFLGWMLAGVQMGNFPLINGAMVREFQTQTVRSQVSALSETVLRSDAERMVQHSKASSDKNFDASTAPLEKVIDRVAEGRIRAMAGTWFGYYICAFLLGAAAGGLIFGWLGDKIGRAKAMGLSIVWYSVFAGLCYFGQTLEQMLALRFICCLGVGGMWPTGVALASEAWSNRSRPLLAGIFGTSANVGLAMTGALERLRPITIDDWRWVMAVSALPVFVGLFSLCFVPESPSWKAKVGKPETAARITPVATVFRPPYLSLTILGIILGTIPLLGGWGSSNWLISWADQVGLETSNETLKGRTMVYGSTGAAIGSLFGGWIATRWGRRKTYFAISLGSLIASAYIFWFLTPRAEWFLPFVFLLRVISTTYFGWLPLYLPELFPTEIRSTGSGVTFNFGRILSAAGVLGTSALVTVFHSDYARMGRVTHLIFALGMVVIFFAPDTSKRRMDD